MWSAGQTIGSYKLVASLRAGGMATLFLAQKLGAAGFARPVAIKLVHPELQADEQFRQMFLDEALLASRIHHPNVVQVEELAEFRGAHYLVMEFVHGCSLAQLMRVLYLRQRRLTPAFAVRIAMHVAEGLHAAHEACDERGQPLSVVHRDVSPENILLAYAGHVKLIDFGIAKAFGRRHRTQEGLVKGKFRYMTPEQAYARPVDRRTDIYQLGIVLWEMLTLSRLFDADNDAELIQQVRAPHVPPPSSQVSRIPPALDDAVMAALAADPARRPPDAQTFARMLAKAVPEAFAVDGGALQALLMGAMQDEKQRQAATFPPAVFAALEREVETLRYGSPEEPAPLSRYTLEHVEGGASPAVAASEVEERATQPERARAAEPPSSPDLGRGPLGALGLAGAISAESAGSSTEPEVRPPAQRSHTQHGFGSPGRGASERVLAARAGRRRGRRSRRLVRLASELRTTITRIGESEWAGSPVVWLLGGAGGACLVALLVLGAAQLRDRMLPALPPPPPVRAHALAGPPALPLPPRVTPPEPPTPSEPSAPPTAVVAPAPPHAEEPSQVAAPARGAGRAAGVRPAKRVRGPSDVDGTPLLVEPGF